MKKKGFRESLLTWLILVFAVTAVTAQVTPTPSGPYNLDHIQIWEPEHHWEWRAYYNEHHFLTLSEFDDGRVTLRPHPGCDPNGWGSTLYLMPYTAMPLRNATGDVIVFNDRIEVQVTGSISDGTAPGFGSFAALLSLTYDPVDKIIDGNGDYSITRYLGTPTPLPDHLKLYFIASNYLCNVPLQSGGVGDTGDTGNIQFQVEGLGMQTWHPPDGTGHYPQDFGDWVEVNAPACYNEVDNTQQGQCTPTPNYTPVMIAAAYKPSLEIDIYAQPDTAGLHLGFGANYAQVPSDSCQQVEDPCCPCKQFWSDNVGINPLVYTHSPPIPQTLHYDLFFTSQAHPNDPTCTPAPPPLPATNPTGITILIILLSLGLVAAARPR